MNFKKEKKQQLNTQVSPWIIERIEHLMEIEGCSKNLAVEELLKYSLREYEIKIGGWPVRKNKKETP